MKIKLINKKGVAVYAVGLTVAYVSDKVVDKLPLTDEHKELAHAFFRGTIFGAIYPYHVVMAILKKRNIIDYLVEKEMEIL